MRSRRFLRALIGAGLSATVFSLASPKAAQGFCNQTHQQLIEVAYAYLKTAADCEFTENPHAAIPPSVVSDYLAGRTSCAVEFPQWVSNDDAWCGWCMRDMAPQCPGFSFVDGAPGADIDAYSRSTWCTTLGPAKDCYPGFDFSALGSDRRGCIAGWCRLHGGPQDTPCSDTDPTHSCMSDCIAGSGWYPYCGAPCRRPAIAWDSANNQLVVTGAYPLNDKTDGGYASPELARELCDSLLYQELYLPPDSKPECSAFASAFLNGALSANEAGAVVTFLQNVNDIPCPRSDFKNHDGVTHACADPGVTPATWSKLENAKALSLWEGAPRTNDFTSTDGQKTRITTSNADLVDIGDTLTPALRSSDFTGTILGVSGGIADSLDDLYVHGSVFPLGQDVIAALEWIPIMGVGSAYTAAALGAASLACVLDCLLSGFDCGDCWSNSWDATKDNLKEAQAVADKAKRETYDALSWDGDTKFGSHDLSPFHHFAMSYSGSDPEFDDLDGIHMTSSDVLGGWFDSWGVSSVPAVDDTLVKVYDKTFGLLWNYRVDYRQSARGLSNYQIASADDGMQNSSLRGAMYWYETDLLDLVFSPADNMAYYWWHKWLYGRNKVAAGGQSTQPYGVFPLGLAIHAVQDMGTRHHVLGTLGSGHAEYERVIREDFNLLPRASDEPPRYLNPSEFTEWAFLARIGMYLRILNDAAFVGGRLNVRKLAHEVRRLNLDYFAAHSGIDGHARDVVIPLTIAATVLMMREGAGTNYSSYGDAVAHMAQFERMGAVPPLDGESDGPGPDLMCANRGEIPWTSAINAAMPTSAVGGAEGDPDELPFADSLNLSYAVSRDRTRQAAQAYFANQMSGEAFLRVIFEEQARGNALDAGLPEPDAATLSAIADAEIAKQKALGDFWKTGSLPKLEQAMACARLKMPAAVLPNAEVAKLTATCSGTLDTDGDGVPDLIDQCLTSPDLLEAGNSVKADGCVFEHAAVLKPNLNLGFLGAIKTPL